MNLDHIPRISFRVYTCNFQKGIVFKQVINLELKRWFYLNINAYLLENVAINV